MCEQSVLQELHLSFLRLIGAVKIVPHQRNVARVAGVVMAGRVVPGGDAVRLLTAADDVPACALNVVAARVRGTDGVGCASVRAFKVAADARVFRDSEGIAHGGSAKARHGACGATLAARPTSRSSPTPHMARTAPTAPSAVRRYIEWMPPAAAAAVAAWRAPCR